MKIRHPFFAIFLFVTAAIVWSSCDNELDLNSDWQNIPVVNAMFSIDDDVHYVRIQRAYLDDNTSAIELADIQDSIYYDEIDVRLRVNDGEAFDMERVIGADVDLAKEEGVFAEDPHFLYKIDQNAINLEEGDIVQIEIDRGNGLPLVTARTQMVGPIDRLISPARTSSGGREFVNFVGPNGARFAWIGNTTGHLYDMKLGIVYLEFPNGNPADAVEKRIVFTADANIDNDTISLPAIGPAGLANPNFLGVEQDRFYSFIGGAIEPSTDLSRDFVRLEVIITGGSKEFIEIFDLANANTGITSSQEIPFYTNVSEGRGVVASRNEDIINTQLSGNSMDSLRNGRFTKDLNFVD